jgi:hypothetical protein
VLVIGENMGYGAALPENPNRVFQCAEYDLAAVSRRCRPA